LTEEWIRQSQEMLKVLKDVASKKGEDRLELVNSMNFALNAIDRSIHGWRSWIQNLALMTKFSEDELREMKEGLIKEARDFIEHDIEVSIKHRDKIPRIVIPEERGERPGVGFVA